MERMNRWYMYAKYRAEKPVRSISKDKIAGLFSTAMK